MDGPLSSKIYDFLVNETEFAKEIKIGIPKTEHVIGKGTRGVVFDIGGGKALKITDDISEAKVAEQLKNKDLRGLYRTFGAYQFTNYPTSNQLEKLKSEDLENEIKDVYFIVMEKLHGNRSRALPIRRMGDKLGSILHFISDTSSSEWSDKNFKRFLEKENLDLLTNATGGSEQLTDDMIEMAYGLNYLNKLGIDFNDLHEGNIMFNSKGEPVIIDIGYSHGGTGSPKVFEGIGPY